MRNKTKSTETQRNLLKQNKTKQNQIAVVQFINTCKSKSHRVLNIVRKLVLLKLKRNITIRQNTFHQKPTKLLQYFSFTVGNVPDPGSRRRWMAHTAPSPDMGCLLRPSANLAHQHQHNFMLHFVPIYSTSFPNSVNLYFSAIFYYHRLNNLIDTTKSLKLPGKQSPAGRKARKRRQSRQSITYYNRNSTKTPHSPARSMLITLRN